MYFQKLFSIKCYQRYTYVCMYVDMECKCNLIIIHDIHHFVVFFFLLICMYVVKNTLWYKGSILLHANENFNTRFLTNFYIIIFRCFNGSYCRCIYLFIITLFLAFFSLVFKYYTCVSYKIVNGAKPYNIFFITFQKKYRSLHLKVWIQGYF